MGRGHAIRFMEVRPVFRLNHPMTLGAAIAFWILAAGLIWYRGGSLAHPGLVLGGIFVVVLIWEKFDPRIGQFFRSVKRPGDP
jgi:hypothetical protein